MCIRDSFNLRLFTMMNIRVKLLVAIILYQFFLFVHAQGLIDVRHYSIEDLSLIHISAKYYRYITQRYDSNEDMDVYHEQQMFSASGGLSIKQNLDLSLIHISMCIRDRYMVLTGMVEMAINFNPLVR